MGVSPANARRACRALNASKIEAKVRKQITANGLLVARVTGFGVNLLIR
jgi:hypothetical protein